jgi:multiple antibiotic resistance protein
MNLKEIISVTLILFSIIDMLGSIPIIISLKSKGYKIEPLKATFASAVIMIAFLFVGNHILAFFGVDIHSFAIAGGIVILIIGLEMILGVDLFREEETEIQKASVFPLAFPLVAGAGTLTTILSLKAEYETVNITIGILLNLIIIFVVIKSSSWLNRKLGRQGTTILRKVFGIILLAIAIKLIKTNW